MLVNIGPTPEPADVVDLLMECHERIRSFISLANRLAKAGEASADEVRDAAKRVTRYFSESLPLHVEDEENSILPRLSGKNSELDAALEAMHREHGEHEPYLESLLNTCRLLQASPGRLPELSPVLLETAKVLEQEFIIHLEKEEQVILPAIRTFLRPEEREAVLHELRARRQHLR